MYVGVCGISLMSFDSVSLLELHLVSLLFVGKDLFLLMFLMSHEGNFTTVFFCFVLGLGLKYKFL